MLNDNSGTMRKIFSKSIAFTLAMILVITLFPTTRASADVKNSDEINGTAISNCTDRVSSSAPDITAKSAIVVDENGNVIYSRKQNVKRKIASITKIMTAIIASRYPMSTKITVDSESAATDGSGCGLFSGDSGELHELLEGLLLPSGNDAAYSIAVSLGEKMIEDDYENSASDSDKESQDVRTPTRDESLKRFVDEMNTEAETLGMNDTSFENPCGLDDGKYSGKHHSTASDIAKMTREFESNKELSGIASEKTGTMDLERNGTKVSVPLTNTNILLSSYDGARGTKTGYTDAAGACFAGTFDDDGETYYTVVLGDIDHATSFSDTRVLWDWEKSTIEKYKLISNSDSKNDDDNNDNENDVIKIGTIGIQNRNNTSIEVGIDYDGKTMTKRIWDDYPAYSIDVALPDDDINEGDTVGSISYSDANGNEIAKYDIVSLENIESPSIFERMRIAAERLLSFATHAGVPNDSLIIPTPSTV